MLQRTKSMNGEKAVTFPSTLRQVQRELIAQLGIQADDSKGLALAVKRLSDFYLNHPEKSTPWEESWVKVAYLAYYLPLNWWRATGVVSRGQQLNFFDGFECYIDFGSGLGSVSHAFDGLGVRFASGVCLEKSKEAIALHRSLSGDTLTPLLWDTSSWPLKIQRNALAVFSYALTELERLPSWVDECEGLMVIEPSTRDDARRLQSLRSDLLERGWHVWGPCTHAEGCPLLLSGERDWCHDRFNWQQPDWLRAIESHLPIKNGTLPCSWLMMRRTPPPRREKLGRITGDLLEFKGYAKQLVCRGSSREFLSWQKKFFKSFPQIGRGELVELADNITVKGQELRLATDSDVVVLP